mmetsp:Transcript_23026/g.78746  ORF Transcript_23026/g.78746 Transcript_23026/m.78746 type:complete len:337 (-) Transcript_23026:1846-2856(-)
MAALEGRALGVGPSKVLLQVLGITGHDIAATVSPAFVAALQQWDVAGGAPRTIDDFGSPRLLPAHNIGVATTGALLYLVSVGKKIKSQGKHAPIATHLPSLLFKFFGFFDPSCVSSPLQLYKTAKNMVGQRGLEGLADDVDACRMYLHGPCFEAPPVPRRSSTSSRESTETNDRRAADRLVAERARLERASSHLDAKKAELHTARPGARSQEAETRRSGGTRRRSEEEEEVQEAKRPAAAARRAAGGRRGSAHAAAALHRAGRTRAPAHRGDARPAPKQEGQSDAPGLARRVLAPGGAITFHQAVPRPASIRRRGHPLSVSSNCRLVPTLPQRSSF